MKRLLLAILVIGIFLLGACSAPSTTPSVQPEPPIPAHFSTYTDETGRFSISYPPDWEVDFSKEELFHAHAVVPNAVVTVTVTVGATDEGNWKLEDFADLVFQRAYIRDAEEYHEFSRTKVTVDGKEAIIFDFEIKYPFAPTAMRDLVLLLRDRDNELLWTVYSGAMPSKDFSYFEADLHAIVRSLRILK